MTLKPKRAQARRMRKNPQGVEAELWDLLRDRRLEGLKFRRQVPLGRYVLDFVCFGRRLIVEADGPFHDPVADAERDAFFKAQGFKVLRFTNSQVVGQSHWVIATVLDAAGTARPLIRPLRGHLLPQGEKGRGS